MFLFTFNENNKNVLFMLNKNDDKGTHARTHALTHAHAHSIYIN